MPHVSHSNTRVTLVALGILVWILGSLGGLWWFQQQTLQPFIADDAPPSSRSLAHVDRWLQEHVLAGNAHPGKVTLVHLWNPDCLCNNVSARHTQAVLNAYSDDELALILLAPAHLSPRQQVEAKRLNPRATLVLAPPGPVPLTSSPGLAMVGPDGKLGYYGAYGFGALCSLSEDNLFTNMVASLLAGEKYGPFMNTAGSGCFCDWPVD